MSRLRERRRPTLQNLIAPGSSSENGAPGLNWSGFFVFAPPRTRMPELLRYSLMRCPQCAAENHEGARFCSACGAKMRITTSEQAPRVLAFSCFRCGQTVPPSPYFSRGVNVAKLAALFPINFVLPILFFFVRRDRLICGNCKKVLPEAAPRALMPYQGAEQGALMPMPGSFALVPQQPAALAMERASQQARNRGIGLGVIAMPFSMGALAMLGGAGFTELAFVVAPGALLIGGAVASLRRAGKLKQGAREIEEKQQRRRVLELAARRQGRLTVADVASSLGMDLKDAEHVLDTLVDGRHVDVEVTDEGRLLYVFPDLSSAARPSS